jgi:hypothetical protein
MSTATTTPTALRVIKRPDRPAELPGVEVVELPERDSDLALLEQFGVVTEEIAPVNVPAELALIPIERDRFEDKLQRAFGLPERTVRRGLP